MKTVKLVLATAGLMLMFGTGCGPGEPPTQHRDGGTLIGRESCDVPSMNCYNSCFKREAGLTCTGCCRDQRRLCDRAEKYAFETCESVK